MKFFLRLVICKRELGTFGSSEHKPTYGRVDGRRTTQRAHLHYVWNVIGSAICTEMCNLIPVADSAYWKPKGYVRCKGTTLSLTANCTIVMRYKSWVIALVCYKVLWDEKPKRSCLLWIFRFLKQLAVMCKSRLDFALRCWTTMPLYDVIPSGTVD